MTLDLLRRLDRSRVFQPVLPPEALSALHVPFDRLVGEDRCEARLSLVAEAPAPVLLIGPSGCGKSSAVSWSIAPEAGALGIVVPVHAHTGTGAVPSALLAGLVVAALRRAVPDDVVDLGLEEQGRSRWRRSAAVDLGVLRVGLEEQLPASLEPDLGQQRDAILQALEVVRRHGLEPVLVLDDTDKWVPRGGEVAPAVEDFFAGPVRWLIDLGVALVVHVHDRYEPYLGEAASWFSDRIHVPDLAPPQVREILHERMTAVAATGTEAFEDAALDRILGTVFEERGSVRAAISLAGTAIKEAVLAHKDVVDLHAVDAALLDRT